MTTKQETFKVAHERIFEEAKNFGWMASSSFLKVRHLTSPDGSKRLWFKPQAVWLSEGKHTFGEARSVHIDVRGLPTEELLKCV